MTKNPICAVLSKDESTEYSSMSCINNPYKDIGKIGWDDDLDIWVKRMKEFELKIFARLYNKNWIEIFFFNNISMNIKEFSECNKKFRAEAAKYKSIYTIVIEDNDDKTNGKQEVDTDDEYETKIDKLNKNHSPIKTKPDNNKNYKQNNYIVIDEDLLANPKGNPKSIQAMIEMEEYEEIEFIIKDANQNEKRNIKLTINTTKTDDEDEEDDDDLNSVGNNENYDDDEQFILTNDSKKRKRNSNHKANDENAVDFKKRKQIVEREK